MSIFMLYNIIFGIGYLADSLLIDDTPAITCFCLGQKLVTILNQYKCLHIYSLRFRMFSWSSAVKICTVNTW
jgi:hypothetical protein